jgi:hypothetical protein
MLDRSVKLSHYFTDGHDDEEDGLRLVLSMVFSGLILIMTVPGREGSQATAEYCITA